MLPLDGGRCHAFEGAAAGAFGDMFAVLQLGDMLMRDGASGQWFCYRPGRDLLIPVFFEASLALYEKPVSPFSRQRPTSVLYRFSKSRQQKAGNVNYHAGVNLREALLEEHDRWPIEGAQAGSANIVTTHLDMQKSILCVCPPGIVQQTLRTYRAIASGCIPVTYTRAFDRPFERILGLEWEKFTVNINPDEHHLTRAILTELLLDTKRLHTMQQSLQSVQAYFWRNPRSSDGLEANLVRELTILGERFVA